MTVGIMGNSALNTFNSRNWSEKLVEAIQRVETSDSRDLVDMIKFGQGAGLVRKDFEPELMSSILLEIRFLIDNQLLSQDLIDNVIDVLFKGLNAEVNEVEDN